MVNKDDICLLICGFLGYDRCFPPFFRPEDIIRLRGTIIQKPLCESSLSTLQHYKLGNVCKKQFLGGTWHVPKKCWHHVEYYMDHNL
jgi:hypothetical protein